jgi:RNase P/RNase MRP subunit p29
MLRLGHELMNNTFREELSRGELVGFASEVVGGDERYDGGARGFVGFKTD